MSRTRTSTRRSARAASLLAAAGLGAGLLTACQPPAATFVVNTGVDAVDANIGDGVCATSTGDCSVRAAVQEGNANPNAGPIEVQLSLEVHALTIPGGNEHDAAVGDLDLTGVLVQQATPRIVRLRREEDHTLAALGEAKGT